MSAHEWKSGDVALVTLYDGTTSRAIMRHDGSWRLAESCVNNGIATDPRPLVVIDPERILPDWPGSLLSSLLEACALIVAESVAPWEVHETTLLNNLTAAFAAVCDEPKPAEPTGLGAVVEDADGQRWVKVHAHLDSYRQSTGTQLGIYLPYYDINVVRVLSEGVTL